MTINDAGLALIKQAEGLRLEAYRCPAGVLTIGYGCTTNVHTGMVITPGEAERRLHDDLALFENGVTNCLGGCPTNQNQFSAMVSLAYNIGLGKFATSTVLKKHRLGNRLGAADAFLLWNRGGGQILKGLQNRREAERMLYLS
jgi:lysozyme